jgi:hypothetical protein
MEEAVTPLSAPPMQSLACPGDNQSTFIPQRIQPTAEESDVDQEEATMDIKNVCACPLTMLISFLNIVHRLIGNIMVRKQ